MLEGLFSFGRGLRSWIALAIINVWILIHHIQLFYNELSLDNTVNSKVCFYSCSTQIFQFWCMSNCKCCFVFFL